MGFRLEVTVACRVSDMLEEKRRKALHSHWEIAELFLMFGWRLAVYVKLCTGGLIPARPPLHRPPAERSLSRSLSRHINAPLFS